MPILIPRMRLILTNKHMLLFKIATSNPMLINVEGLTDTLRKCWVLGHCRRQPCAGSCSGCSQKERTCNLPTRSIFAPVRNDFRTFEEKCSCRSLQYSYSSAPHTSNVLKSANPPVKQVTVLVKERPNVQGNGLKVFLVKSTRSTVLHDPYL